MKNTLFYILKILFIAYFLSLYISYIKAQTYNNKFINIYSNTININYTGSVTLVGHVCLQKANNIIYSDKLILEYIKLKDNKKHLLKIVAIGHVIFFDKLNKITADKIKLYFDICNVYINNYYSIVKIKKYNNSYNTLYNISNIFITNGKLYLCSMNHSNIIIYGSKIIYNYYDKIIKIWNTKFKLGNIPIFYSPYSYFTNNNKSSYFGILLPSINYNKGIELNIPYRVFSNFHSYEVIITPSIKQNIFNLKNKFNYLNNNYYGSLEFSFIPSQEKVSDNSWLFYWSNTLRKNNYQLDIIYNKFNHYDFINFLNINDYIKNKIIKKYHLLINNKNLNNDILYEKFLKKNNIYDINSLINFYYHKNLYKKLINFTILGQFIRSTGSINNTSKYFYILPKIDYIIPTKLGIINSLLNLNILYKSENINLNHYNKINNLINSKYIHIMPEININWYTIIKLFNKNYTQIIKPIIKYKYNLLNNKFDFNNLYQDELIYLSNNISKNKFFSHYFFEGFKTLLLSKNIEKLYFSLGRIHYIVPNYNQYSKTINHFWFNTHFIKNKFTIDNSIEFFKNINNIIFNNTKIKYKFKNTRFLTINYYYLNLDKLLNFFKHQIKINFNWVINKNLTINSQNNFNINNSNIDNQMINIKYKNCHFNFIIKYEYKLIYNNLIKKNNNHFSFSFGVNN
ncbi:MAG: hypothetical protein N4P89_00520 [Candidatus Lightella neohaematopini]|nr:hypothetical protein [Candidatus Lightella neohaematopini]MCV2528749.1 hypothetical protein [Candidatus Lightella neohaematopini]